MKRDWPPISLFWFLLLALALVAIVLIALFSTYLPRDVTTAMSAVVSVATLVRSLRAFTSNHRARGIADDEVTSPPRASGPGFMGRALLWASAADRRWRFSIPPLSQWLVSVAIHRLPDGMSASDRARWAQEMRADVANEPSRLKRLRMALGIWWKGAPAMPIDSGSAPRLAGDVRPGDEDRQHPEI